MPTARTQSLSLVPVNPGRVVVPAEGNPDGGRQMSEIYAGTFPTICVAIVANCFQWKQFAVSASVCECLLSSRGQAKPQRTEARGPSARVPGWFIFCRIKYLPGRTSCPAQVSVTPFVVLLVELRILFGRIKASDSAPAALEAIERHPLRQPHQSIFLQKTSPQGGSTKGCSRFVVGHGYRRAQKGPTCKPEIGE